MKNRYWKFFVWVVFSTLMMFIGMTASASEMRQVDASQNGFVQSTSDTASITVGQVKTQLLKNLETDGYLSQKLASEALTKYVSPEDAATPIGSATSTTSTTSLTNNSATPTQTASWTDYVSFINFVKVLAVGLLLFFMSGVLKAVVKGMWGVITIVPAIVYQVVFLMLSLYGTVSPESVWASESFYVALFCSITNLMIVSWIGVMYPKVMQKLARLFSLGIPASVIVSFWAMVYFATLAIVYQSSMFGFFAAVALSGTMSFAVMYSPGVVFLHFEENRMASLITGHIAVLGLYALAYKTGFAANYIVYFHAGIQYYCATALGVGLLVAASPFYKTREALKYTGVFVAVFAASVACYFFLGLTTMSTVIMMFFALFFLEWVGYVGFKGGWVMGCGLTGGLLYASALVFERYGAMVATNLKAVL